MEYRDIDELRYEESGDASYDDPHTLPEYGEELFIGDAADAFGGWNVDGEVQNEKAMNDSLLTPFCPKYSLMRSVVMNTIGHGKIPMLMTYGPIWISFPPMSSAVTALVMKMPARMMKIVSFLVLNIKADCLSNITFSFLLWCVFSVAVFDFEPLRAL